MHVGIFACKQMLPGKSMYRIYMLHIGLLDMQQCEIIALLYCL